MLGKRLVAVVLGLALAASPAAAQEEAAPEVEEEAPAEPAPDTSREGAYGGVKPGEPTPSGGERPAPRPGRNAIGWVGFEERDDGGALIFVQVGSEVGYSQRVEGGALVVHLEGVKRLGKNVRRPLITRFFETPIARVTTKKVGKRRATRSRPARKAGAEVRIEFKDARAAREANARAAVEADGLFYLYLEIPPAPSGG